MSRLHKDAVIGNRHPIHALSEFSSTGARDAHTYLSEDVGKVVSTGTGSGRQFWLIKNVVSGAATFLELGAGGAPDAHATSHQNGGSDEISVAGLSGLLADAQTPLAHESSHRPGGSDAVPTAAPGTIQPDDSAAEGTAASLARSDHRHAIAAAAAGAATPGDSASEGTSSSFARADHKHLLPPFGTTAGTFAEGDDLAAIDARLTDVETALGIIGQQWVPDVPPTGSAHSKSDEFDGSAASALNARWSEFDQSGELTLDHDGKGSGVMTVVDQGANNRSVAMYQAVPAVAAYAFACKLHLAQPGGVTGVLSAGIFLSDDLDAAPTTADWQTIREQQGNTLQVDQSTFTAYNANATINVSVSRTDRDVYFRVRVTSTTTVAMDWSNDGKGWHELRSFTIGFTPVHMGVFCRNRSGGTAYVRVEWFRVVEATVALGDLSPGGRMQSFVTS